MAITEDQLLRSDLYSWMIKRAVLPNGKPYSFDGHEYLIEPAKRAWKVGKEKGKPGDEVFFEKPSQVGVSEFLINFAFWMCERKLPNYKGIGYFFPATPQLRDHIKARVIPILETPYFKQRRGMANLSYVQYAGCPIYFRGGQTRRDLISMPLDAAIIDEFDEFEDPVGVIPTLEARFGASDYGFLLGASTPTLPDTGIDQAFSLSNQFNWYVKCDLCSKDFPPLLEVKNSGFENCVVRSPISKKVGFICPHCGELTQTNNGGQWVLDQKKDVQKYAYGISRLFTKRHSLDAILSSFEEALNIQEFYNSVLGIAYTTGNSKIDRQDIVDLCGPEPQATFSEDSTWMGVDVGRKCYWVVGKVLVTGHKQIIAYGNCPFDDLNSVVNRFNVKYGVIDLRPYENEAKRFIAGRRGFLACDFNTGNQEEWYKVITVDGEVKGHSTRILKADRTQSCDVLLREISSRKNFVFPSTTKGDNEFIRQVCAPARMEETSKKTGDVKAIYTNSGKADHYFFALLYFILSTQMKRGLSMQFGGSLFK